MYEVHEYVYTDDRSLPVYNFYATENTLPALSWQPLKEIKFVNFLTWTFISPLSRIDYSLVYHEKNVIVACIFN